MSLHLMGEGVPRQLFHWKMVILQHLYKFHTFPSVISLLALHVDCSTGNYFDSNFIIITILHFKIEETSFCTTLELQF